nr:MAG TPA: hypothetical protein [Caudoviricetes sp.]
MIDKMFRALLGFAVFTTIITMISFVVSLPYVIGGGILLFIASILF